jgi:GT2 family glycosyltransferase
VAQGSQGGGCTSRRGASGESRRDPTKDEVLAVSVVVCAYTERRWVQTRAAIDSVLGQRPGPAQVLLVVDHNAALGARARCELTGVTVVESDAPPGLSGARNTGLSAATQPITAFLDDDAEAQPGWLESLVQPYSSTEVVATGGSVHPVWPNFRPRWLPPAFDWVVGCSYLGLPDSLSKVRNPIGANMSMRTHLALEVGGFDTTIGRVGNYPKGCEETELAIRLTASRPGSFVLYVPTAAVDHHVAPERVRVSYFLRRCWHEGLSKSVVVRLAGSSAGLQRERRHVAVVIPRSILRDLRGLTTGDSSAPMRMTVALSGLVATSFGYLVGRARISARGQLANQRTPLPAPEAVQTLDFPADAL